jgi:hypothetical protein
MPLEAMCWTTTVEGAGRHDAGILTEQVGARD